MIWLDRPTPIQEVTATAPTLTGVAYPGTTGTDACSADAATQHPLVRDAIQGYTDNCGGAVTATLTNTSVTGDDCAWTVTYTFTVSDACGNDLAGQTYANTGGDATAPTLTGVAYPGTTGTDACSADAATAAPLCSECHPGLYGQLRRSGNGYLDQHHCHR